MKKLSTILLLLIFTFISTYAQKLSVDTDKSKIKWIGKEITTSMHYGTLKFSSGEITLNSGKISGAVSVNMESISVDDLSGGSKSRLEGHLRSDDFFSVENHKESKIEVISSKQNGSSYDVNGRLTIKNISHPINFTLDMKDKMAQTKLTFDRSKYDVRFRSGSFFENLGDKLILDDIELEVTLYFN